MLAGASALAESIPELKIKLRENPAATVGKFGKVELAFDLSRTYDDPFDPETIDVEARFTAPSGKEIVTWAFYYQDYPREELMKRCKRGVSSEQSPAAGGHTGAHWRVRFAPQEEGRYQGCLVAKDKQGQCRLELPTFTAVRSDNPGFIHAKPCQKYLEHESGKPFISIGECLWKCYSLQDFQDSLKIYPQWGMNYCRFFTAYDSPLYIDNAFYAGGGKRPMGQYDLFALRQLDLFFDMAAEYGVYLMPCLEMFNAFRATPPYQHWDEMSYNAKNGGPCASVPEFFTNETAIKHYQRKMRYFLARYGYSPNLFCLQLFAEVNYIEQYNEAEVRAWHHRIARYIHAIDPYGHLVSTSMADWEAQDQSLFADPSLDLVLNENYNARDFEGDLAQDTRRILERYGKPVFDGESGLQFGQLSVKDERGLYVHNALWASVLSGASGTPSNWFHYYTRQRNWLPSYKAFADFLKNEDLRGLNPIQAKVVSCKPTTIHPDQIIPYPYRNPGVAVGPQTVIIPNDRFVEQAIPNLPTIFKPKYQRDGKSPKPKFNPVTFTVDFAADGVFRMRARWFEGFKGGQAMIRISVDDRLVKEVNLACNADSSDWKAYMEDLLHNSEPFSVPIGKGKHRIVVENDGTMWISAEVDFSNYIQAGVVNVRVFGQGGKDRAYLWIQNRDSGWWRDYLGQSPRPIEQAVIDIAGLDPGDYTVEWLDPWGVKPPRRQTLTAKDRGLRLVVKNLERDIACKIKRHSGTTIGKEK